MRFICQAMRVFGLSRWVVLLVVGSQMCALPHDASAEWYVAGYGGWSVPSKLNNVAMDNFGQSQAEIFFPGTLTPTNGKANTLIQSFHTGDVALKSSALFGGKAGYFFKDEGFSWLGVELEAFTSQPTIKSQPVDTRHDVTYLPAEPLPPPPGVNCVFGISCQTQQVNTGTLKIPETSLRLIALAFNVVARYPGKVFQPYVAVGVGAFYFTTPGRGPGNVVYSAKRYDTGTAYTFTSSSQIDGRQVAPGLNLQAGVKVLATEEWGLFLEGKYNRATITNLDPVYGLSGEYSAFNIVGGLAYHF